MMADLPAKESDGRDRFPARTAVMKRPHHTAVGRLRVGAFAQIGMH